MYEKNYKISLVVPSRNRASKLPAFFENLPLKNMQQHDIELILIDSCSTDDTYDIMCNYFKNCGLRGKVLRVEKPGKCLAMNHGLKVATGNLFAFTDDDCYYQPDYFDKLIELFDHTQFQFAGGNVKLYDPTDAKITIFWTDKAIALPPKNLIRPGMIMGANFVAHKSVFDKIGLFREDIGFGTHFGFADIEFAIRASINGFTGRILPELVVLHHHGRKTNSVGYRTSLKSYAIGRGALFMAILEYGHISAFDFWKIMFSRVAKGRKGIEEAWYSLAAELRGASDYIQYRKKFSIHNMGIYEDRSDRPKTNKDAKSYLGVDKDVWEYDIDILKYRFDYGSFVSTKHKYMYVETPKAACTSIKRLIQKIEGLPYIKPLSGISFESKPDMFIHSRKYFDLPSINDLPDAERNEILTKDDWLRFAVVRNPYSRLFSAWSDKISFIEPSSGNDFERYNKEACDQFPEEKEGKVISFKGFVKYCTKNLDQKSTDYNAINPHFRNQRSLLLPQAINYSFIAKLENLENDLKPLADHLKQFNIHFSDIKIPQKNESKGMNWQAFYDQETADMVYDYYKQDFECFQYDKDSWKTDKADNDKLNKKQRIKYLENEIIKRNKMLQILYEERNKF